MVVRAPINPATLTWAREAMHADVEDLARAAGIKPEVVLRWETDDALPTVRQLQKVAKKLGRSVAFFYAPPPEVNDIPTTADFRRIGQAEVDSKLAREIQRVGNYRNRVLELDDQTPHTTCVAAITKTNADAQAQEFRLKLGLDDDFTPPGKTEQETLKSWCKLLMQHGYLVFQASGISVHTFRGLSIYHDQWPIILLNGADSANGRIFTLFHEVAHLCNRTSGICALEEQEDEEVAANRFASSVLMPSSKVNDLVATWDDENPDAGVIELAEYLAKHFKVSLLAAAVKLKSIHRIHGRQLDEVRVHSDKLWAEAQKQRKQNPGFPPRWRLKYRNLGEDYVGLVAQALDDGRVDWLDATYLLDERLPTVEKMIDHYHQDGAGQ